MDKNFTELEEVILKSGGPLMQIKHITEAGNLFCEWFDNQGVLNSHEFLPAQVVRPGKPPGVNYSGGSWRK